MQGIHWDHIFDRIVGFGFEIAGIFLLFFIGAFIRSQLRPAPTKAESTRLRVWYRMKLWSVSAGIAAVGALIIANPVCDPDEYDCQPETRAEKQRYLNNSVEFFFVCLLVIGFGTESEATVKKMDRLR